MIFRNNYFKCTQASHGVVKRRVHRTKKRTYLKVTPVIEFFIFLQNPYAVGRKKELLCNYAEFDSSSAYVMSNTKGSVFLGGLVKYNLYSNC